MSEKKTFEISFKLCNVLFRASTFRDNILQFDRAVQHTRGDVKTPRVTVRTIEFARLGLRDGNNGLNDRWGLRKGAFCWRLFVCFLSRSLLLYSTRRFFAVEVTSPDAQTTDPGHGAARPINSTFSLNRRIL